MADLAQQYARDGFVVFDADPRVLDWVQAAHPIAQRVSQDPEQRAVWLRHGDTWFVGVDALPNVETGAVNGVSLRGPWEELIETPKAWHKAQVSVTYPNYPQQDKTDSAAAHRFRIKRAAAHVDGLHLEQGRRIVREPHAFILGLPLNRSDACPLVVWRASHVAMKAALRGALGESDPRGQDVTEVYTAARAAAFERCERVEVHMQPGQAVLVDRFLVHGVAPWWNGMHCPDEGRMIAYFRPEFETAEDWLRG